MPAARPFGTVPQRPVSETFTDVVMRPRRWYPARPNLRWPPSEADFPSPWRPPS